MQKNYDYNAHSKTYRYAEQIEGFLMQLYDGDCTVEKSIGILVNFKWESGNCRMQENNFVGMFVLGLGFLKTQFEGRKWTHYASHNAGIRHFLCTDKDTKIGLE